GNVQKLAHMKKKKPDLKIGVVGCMAERHGELLFKEQPAIDILAGPNNIYDIPELIESSFGQDRVLAVKTVRRPKKGADTEYRAGVLSAFVNIMYGCDNFCSYCIVPHVRGREVSRPKKDIVKEVKLLADKGFKEITLLGQNVNSYGKGQTQKVDFPEILEAVNGVKGIERVRFTTSHPKDAGSRLFRAMRDLEKVCEHIHLPLQSGSDRMLDLMNRGYSYDDYRKKVDMLRGAIPDAGISTDLIVGFPSEKEKDFKATEKAMEEVGFNSAFIFKYSPRPPAVSSFLMDDVPEDVKKERNTALLAVQKKISQAKNKALIGTEQEVLVEGPSRMSEKELMGRTRANIPCVFPGGADLVGQVLRVRIKGASPNTLKGEVLSDDPDMVSSPETAEQI
ncbi:MAG: tRNA (N6-isopentenyl adenosine(37)-C2)-methylthiotransferase MiaB, partial [Candidatus Omnitrophica bacterium]|nr:tRNA (N6-isopentenyl adenosine(37)-C2)-methylthiotransferase MiaB [Candidatus Omnitrophota bacterium]